MSQNGKTRFKSLAAFANEKNERAKAHKRVYI